MSCTLRVTASRCSAATSWAMYLTVKNQAWFQHLTTSHRVRGVRARSRLHALAGSPVHHCPPRLRVRLRRETRAGVGVEIAGANVNMAVAYIAAHVEAPSAEVGAAAQLWHVASSREEAALQQQG